MNTATKDTYQVSFGINGHFWVGTEELGSGQLVSSILDSRPHLTTTPLESCLGKFHNQGSTLLTLQCYTVFVS